jgi:hypothetical protein
MLTRGAEIHATGLTESFSFDDFMKKHHPAPLVLFAMDGRDRLKVFTADSRIAPGPGWTVISLIIEDRSEPGRTENADPTRTKIEADSLKS